MVYRENENYTLYLGKMQEELKHIPDNSIDSIVTDPPYELGFMNKSWDSSGVAFQKSTWEECLRVLKPGGHMLAFGGSRTYHRIACAIEDAGFEIRDTIMWLYGSGFPKSMNVGLALDKKRGVETPIVGYEENSMPDFRDVGKKQKELGGQDKLTFGQIENSERKSQPIYKCQNEWAGYGTCLKPSYEPIIMARKPVDGSILENCETYGVGALNIEECRVPLEDGYEFKTTTRQPRADGNVFDNKSCGFDSEYNDTASANPRGRFPANVITDGSDEVAEGFPNTKSTGGSGEKSISGGLSGKVYNGGWSHDVVADHLGGLGDEGSAMRYFYCAKASKKDRDEGLDQFATVKTGELQGGRVEGSKGSMMYRPGCKTREIRENPYCGSGAPKKNIHPTVKPTTLMQYLVRLISPKGATVLDPFMGSGSTGKATMIENVERNANYKFIGVEMTEEYMPICEARINFGLGWIPENEVKNEVKKVKNSEPSKPVEQKVDLW